MKKNTHSIKLNSLSIDQKLFGFLTRLMGLYDFTTEKLNEEDQYEIQFASQTSRLNSVCLYKNKTDVFAFNVDSEMNFKSLQFTVSPDYKFNYVYFCILFKFFFQYIKQSTPYENLILKTSRYQSYLFVRLFGFKMLGQQKNKYFLRFNTNESLQFIWDTFYAINLEENLYNFLLPVDEGGYVPTNVKLRHSTDHQFINHYKETEKKLSEDEQPFAEIKMGYNLFQISICDLSRSGLAFMTSMNEEVPQLQVNHIYNLRFNNIHLNLNWTNLNVQILWQKNQKFGCQIIEPNSTWNHFILSHQIKNDQRLTFKEKLIS